MKRTSFWSKRVAVPDFGPCRVNWAAPYAYALGTKAAVVKWQRAHGNFAGGVFRRSTWRALLRAFKPFA